MLPFQVLNLYKYQDGGSLDLVMKAGRIPVQIIAKITTAVRIFAGISYSFESVN